MATDYLGEFSAFAGNNKPKSKALWTSPGFLVGMIVFLLVVFVVYMAWDGITKDNNRGTTVNGARL